MIKRQLKKNERRFEALFALGKRYDAETDPQEKERLRNMLLRRCDQVITKTNAVLRLAERENLY